MCYKNLHINFYMYKYTYKDINIYIYKIYMQKLNTKYIYTHKLYVHVCVYI